MKQEEILIRHKKKVKDQMATLNEIKLGMKNFQKNIEWTKQVKLKNERDAPTYRQRNIS